MNRRPTTVGVTCVGGRLIYDIIRGLRQAEGLAVQVIGFDADAEAHGRILCDRFAILPRAEDGEREYIEALEHHHASCGFEVLLLLSEGEARAAARNRERLQARGIKLSVSSSETVAALTDKLHLLQRAEAGGLDVGPYIAVDSRADAESALRALGYPQRKVVLKPRFGAGSRGVVIFDYDEREWRALLPNRFCGTGRADAVYSAMEASGAGFDRLIAVPHTDGPVYDVDCIALGGRLLDVATRLRQLRNPLWPTSTGHKIDSNPDVAAMAEVLCKIFAVDGAADFDIAVDRTGKPVLFDAGARFSGSVGGSLAAGANFPGQLVRVLLGLPHRPLRPRNGCVVRPFITMAEIPPANEMDFL